MAEKIESMMSAHKSHLTLTAEHEEMPVLNFS